MPAEMIVKKLEDLVREINRLWVGGNAEKLGEYFHEDMIIVNPELKKMGQGREDCVKGYIDFAAQAKTTSYEESNFEINVWGNTAMANYGFEISYEMGGQKYNDIGRDVFIFSLDDKEGKWRAVWRMIVPTRQT
jgi:ketosteroid isomerase-like protein